MSARGLFRSWWLDTREAWEGFGSFLWPWRPSYYRKLRADFRELVDDDDWKGVLWYLILTPLLSAIWIGLFIGFPLLAWFQPGSP